MRAGLEALADKSLPSLVADADGEVAAAFKGIFKSLMGNRTSRAKSGADGVTKVPCEPVVQGESRSIQPILMGQEEQSLSVEIIPDRCAGSRRTHTSS